MMSSRKSLLNFNSMMKPIFTVASLMAAIASLGNGNGRKEGSLNKQRRDLQSRLQMLLTPAQSCGPPHVTHHKWNQRQARQLRRRRAGLARARAHGSL